MNYTLSLSFFYQWEFHKIICKIHGFCGELTICQYSGPQCLFIDLCCWPFGLTVYGHFDYSKTKLNLFEIYGILRVYLERIHIDEQLFPYRGKTKFAQYIPIKPAKYGIQIWWGFDTKTKYALEGNLSIGRKKVELAKPYAKLWSHNCRWQFFHILSRTKTPG